MPVVDTFDAWRKQARPLLQRQVHPDAVTWQEPSGVKPLFDADDDLWALPIRHHTLNISRDFLARAEVVAFHRREDKWHRLYALVWRLLFEDKRLLRNPVDSQVRVFDQMFKAVSRDRHKMKAFVRFKSMAEWCGDKVDAKQYERLASILPVSAAGEPITKQQGDDVDLVNEYFVAWFEPEHPIVPLVMPFFVKRFANMRWSILTPDHCAHWQDNHLMLTPGVARPPLPEDSREGLWLDYYANIFNPARVKLKMMQSEMPKKYWKNLPEAALIKELTQTAAKQVDEMIEAAGSGDSQKLLNARAVKKTQKHLRAE